MKYYWFCALVQRYQGDPGQIEEGVMNAHPFVWQKRVRYGEIPDLQIYDYNLLNWREITEWDYKLYKQLDGDEQTGTDNMPT